MPESVPATETPTPIWLRRLAYLLTAVAGILSTVIESRAVDTVTAEWMETTWSWFYIIGGVIAFIGLTARRVEGELIGLPILAGAHFFYGGALLIATTVFLDGAYLMVGVLFFSFGMLLMDRWIRLRSLMCIQRDLQKGK